MDRQMQCGGGSMGDDVERVFAGCRHIGRDGGTALKESMNFSTCEIVGTDTHVANSISKEVLQQAVEVLKTRLRNVETAAAQKVEEQMTGMTYSVMLDVLKLWLDEEEQVSARVKEESQQVVDLLRESPNGREAHAAAAATRDSWQAYHKDVVGRVQAVLDSIQQTVRGMQGVLEACSGMRRDGLPGEPLVGSRRVQEAREGVTRHAPSNATMDKLAQIPVLQGIYARKAGDVAHIAHVGEQVKDLTVENATLKQRLSELRSKERQHEGGLEDELKETGVEIEKDVWEFIHAIAGKRDEDEMRQELGLLFESQEICSSAEVMQRLIYSVAQLKHVKEAQVTTRRKRDQVRRKLLEVCHPHFPEVEVALRPMLKHRYQRLELEIHRTGLLMHEGSLRDYDAHFKSGMKLKELKTGRRSVCVMRRKGGTDDDLVVLKEIPLAEERAVRREIVLQATIKHPAILEVHGVFLDKSTYGVPKAYIELPYCRGGHLLEWCLAYDIAHHEKVSWEQLRTMLYSALQGLGHLHALGYVHRDIKPENILVTHDRRAMLCDFGLCAEADRHVQSTTDHPAGPYTEGYKAPEIRDGKPASPASDMWAMGASIEALLGVTQAAGVPRELAPLVQRMRSENEALRPSVTQVLVDPVFAAVLQARAPHESTAKVISSQEKVDQLHLVLKEKSDRSQGRLQIFVSRRRIVDDMLREFRVINPADLQTRLKVVLQDEPEAQDLGGVQDDALSAFFAKVCAEEEGMFESGGGVHDCFLPKQRSRRDLEDFEAFGKILLKALIKKLPIRTRFASYLFAHLLGRAPTEAYYQEFSAEGAEQLAKAQICGNVEQLWLSYTDAGGNDVDVDTGNQRLAVAHLWREQLVTARKKQLDAIKKGFNCMDIDQLARKKVGCTILPKLTPAELKLAICADENLSADDVLAVIYFERDQRKPGHWRRTSNTEQFFREVLQSLDQASLHIFLLRVTGCAALPYNTQQAHIKVHYNPRLEGFNMHTCFNTLEMCEFESVEHLREALAVILDDQTESFNQA
ncbi:hypothetical protein CYMTET_30503 [Cymbomonas tetramitiformis]|uniref:Protein kinase domain-containing protein n=1 Tax=Cymbomonas tetramitiformis TaxID=36881 RepID=A0AAE0KTV4_9CHLO|nr:hypothetical protein CYMTET_30503 [Cymbomonas tetramitiformis]